MSRPPCITVTAAILLVLARASALGQESEVESERRLVREPVLGTLRNETIESRALGRRARFTLYVPPGASRTPPPPLLFLLHGLFEDDHRFHSAGVPQILERAITSGAIPRVVVVAPEGGDGLWVDGPDRRRFRSFLIDEVLPKVEAMTELAPGAKARWLAGTNSGGTGALSIALARPDRFGAAAAVAPFLLGDDPATPDPAERRLFDHPVVRAALENAFGRPIDGAAWKSVHPITLGRTDSGATPPKLLVETVDDPQLPLAPGAERLCAAWTERGIAHEHLRLDHLARTEAREYLPRIVRWLAEAEGFAPARAGPAPGSPR